MSSMMKMVGREGMQMKSIVTFGAVVTAVMAIVLIAFSSLASASAVGRNYDGVGGVLTYEGELPRDANHESRSISVYEGEEIIFEINATGDRVDVIVSGPYEGDGDKRSGCMDYPVKAGKSWDSSGMKTGYFFKVVEEGTEPEIGCWFGLEKQSFSLKLEKDKVQEKESFELSLKTNNKEQGVMELTIEDKEGYSIMNDNAQDIYEVLVNYTGREFDSDPDAEGELVRGIVHDAEGKLVFNTSLLNMNAGKYSIILKDHATEVKEDVDITVEKIYLEVECDEAVLKGKDIVIVIESSFYEEEVDVTFGKEDPMPFTFDEEGKKKVKIPTDDVDYGRYKVTVKAHGMWDTRYVTIKKCETSIEVPGDAIVGDIVHIDGTSESGDSAIFVIDNVFEGEATITDENFKWDWDTSGELDGYRGIEVFILSESAKNPFSVGDTVSDDWQREEGADASASIILFIPTFSMTTSESIAKGDPAVISGEASGTDHVFVIVFNYKGKVMFPMSENMSGVPAMRTPVDEGEWTETVDMLDSGEYVVIALSEGRDGVTKAIKNETWVAGDASKTLEQRVAILMDKMTTAGSDDLYELAYFSVTMPKIYLTVPETVKIGDAISVKAETNMEDGLEAFISLLSNARIINETTIIVKSGSGDASFDTNGLQPGRYTVTGSIKGEAYNEEDLILVESKEGIVAEEVGSAVAEESEEVEESIPWNESVIELETTVEMIESAGESEPNKGQEKAQKLPVNVWDLVIAVFVAIFISIVVRRRC